MIRALLFLALASSTCLAQSTTSAVNGQMKPSSAQVSTPAPRPPALVAEQVPPDATVITVHGLCSKGSASQTAPCLTTITKAEFAQMIAAMSFNPQVQTPVGMRNFAESYGQALGLVEAAEKAGIDKDPQFQELMRIVRVRTLADAYRRYLQQKSANPSAEEIQAYYNQNPSRFDQLELDRIFIPRMNPRLPKDKQAEFEQKAQQVATETYQKAIKGEAASKLQIAAYTALGLNAPASTDIGVRRKGTLPATVEPELFALKSGEISRLQTDSSGFTIYKVRSRTTLPLENVKDEVARELYQKRLASAIQEASGQTHVELNEKFFRLPAPPPADKVPARASGRTVPGAYSTTQKTGSPQ